MQNPFIRIDRAAMQENGGELATYKVKSTQLRSEAARIIEGLRAGDSYIISHYNSYLGYLTPDIPEEIIKKLGVKDRERFKEIR